MDTGAWSVTAFSAPADAGSIADCAEPCRRMRFTRYVFNMTRNRARPHRALQKDAPLRRAVQRFGSIVAIPVLSGLHHQYVRI
jgi:hypothetical protein